MREKVAEEAVTMSFVHGEGIVRAGTKDTGCEVLGKGGDERFFCGGELDESGEVSRDGVKSGDVGKTELTEGVL